LDVRLVGFGGGRIDFRFSTGAMRSEEDVFERRGGGRIGGVPTFGFEDSGGMGGDGSGAVCGGFNPELSDAGFGRTGGGRAEVGEVGDTGPDWLGVSDGFRPTGGGTLFLGKSCVGGGRSAGE